MKYGEKREYDVTNGPGVRTTLFVSGCKHRCKGCFNQEAQDFNYGEEFTKELQDEFIQSSKKAIIRGVNLLGGDPMDHADDKEFIEFLSRLKSEVAKPIWLWTGYTFEQVMSDESKRGILSYVDVLIDGPFVEEKYDIALLYRGSSNQRVIDVTKTLAVGEIVEAI